MNTINCLGKNFTAPLLTWFDSHGRKNLPWQHPRTAYRVWVSEIMLQQTQVKTVIPYFERFMQRFPTIEALATASEDAVLAYWSGLGYYSRARNLLKTARLIDEEYNGNFPQDFRILETFPGIGPSTAAAITSQAFNQPTPILDGNVRRVLSRYFMIEGLPSQVKVQKKLWDLADKSMDKFRCADYTQAIMDLGATCCTRSKPNCQECPVQQSCSAFLHDKVLDFPNKKFKKQTPTKKQQFILLHTTTHDIYLEKRLSTGLWGGLWCCLMLDEDICPKEYLAKRYRIQVMKVQPLINFKHSFSHFHLEIQALAAQIESVDNIDIDTLAPHLEALPMSRNSVLASNHVSSCQVAEPILTAYELNRLSTPRVPASETIASSLEHLGGKWFKSMDIPTLGIPKPLRQIFESYRQSIMHQ